MIQPDTTYDQQTRQQFAQLFTSLILGPENTWRGEDAYYGNPVGQHVGTVGGVQQFTLGQTDTTTAKQADATGALLLVGLVVLVFVLAK